jgi:error-prone DNA polymerase
MGFYSAAVLVKDAQRHRLRIKPIDILRSSWPCTLEKEENGTLSLRLGLRYVRGLREASDVELVAARQMRPFGSYRGARPSRLIADTGRSDHACRSRCPELHRRRRPSQRGALAGRTCRTTAGPLLASLDRDEEVASPLRAMEPQERTVADYASTGVTVGWHPMAHYRPQLRERRVVRSGDLSLLRHGVQTRIAGCVIARQRPGTAHGFIFLSIEDETGIANAIIDPQLYERHRSLITYAKFLLVEGALQNIDKIIHIRAKHIQELNVTVAPMQSHDFHWNARPFLYQLMSDKTGTRGALDGTRQEAYG